MVFFVSYETPVRNPKDCRDGRRLLFCHAIIFSYITYMLVFLCHQESVGEIHRDLQPEQKSVWHHVVLFTQPAGWCRAEEDVCSESACS